MALSEDQPHHYKGLFYLHNHYAEILLHPEHKVLP